jgi:NADH-quinone oxidoreductase subunit G
VQGSPAPAQVAAALEGITPAVEHEKIARALSEGETRLIVLGALAQRHVSYAEIRALAAALAAATGARLGYLPEGGNAVGAALAGVLPHRGTAGRAVSKPGLHAADMLAARLKGYVLVGGVEPADVAPSPGLEAAAQSAECVVAITPFAGPEILGIATVILPAAAFAETSGTWVNVEGRWQSVAGAARPPGEARPAWKVLRVLGNLLGLHGFDYVSSEDVRDELLREVGEFSAASAATSFAPGRLAAVDATREVGIYRVDAVVRRSQPLQQVPDGQAPGGAA